MEQIGEIVRSQVSKMRENRGQTGDHKLYCEKHKKEYDYSRNAGGYCCPVCEKEENEEIRKNLSIRYAYETLDLPPRLKLCTFESFTPANKEAKKALDVCNKFTESIKGGGGLIMLGGVGTGKTHLAIAICQSLCSKGTACKYTTVSRVVREIKSTWQGKGRLVENRYAGEADKYDNEEDIISRYSNYNILVIDEIGSQYGSDTERIVISEIINDRYNNILPTIIIGNVTFSEVQNIIGKRAVDRICDNGQVLVFDWESHRKQA